MFMAQDGFLLELDSLGTTYSTTPITTLLSSSDLLNKATIGITSKAKMRTPGREGEGSKATPALSVQRDQVPVADTCMQHAAGVHRDAL